MALLPTLSVPGEEQLTPEQVERLRQSSGIAAQRGADTSPVAHWSAGLARLVDAYGGYRGNIRAGQQESAGIASADEAIQSNPVLAALLGGDQAGMQQPSGAMSLMETASPQSGTIPSPAPNEVQADPGIADYFSNARRAESGGDDLARNPNSSATGRYQFIDSTWRGLMNNYPELGLTWDGRTDPAQQERAMQRFTSDNAAVLERSGIPVDGGSLYAAHFLGPGGAVNALSQPDQTPMAAVVGDGVVKANPFLANMTVGDFRNWSAQKGGGGAAAPGGMSGGGMPQQGPSPVVGALAQAMGNPWVAQKYGPVMEALMGQEMQRGNMSYQQQLRQSDPMYQAQLQQAQFDLEQDRLGLGGGSSRVQSSEILDDGTVVAVMANGTSRVVSPSGEVLTGQAASDAIRAARDYAVENQRSIYGGRREGTLGANIELGGTAAGAEQAGKMAIEMGREAYEEAGKVRTAISNIDEAISAIDSGAKSGTFAKYLPNITEASASLNNAANKMGLDIIGATTFGALSEGEMRFALDTAMPRDLRPAELRSWLERKKHAQEMAMITMMDAASFLSTPGNTLAMWIERNQSGQAAPQAQPAPQAGGQPAVRTWTPDGGLQ